MEKGKFVYRFALMFLLVVTSYVVLSQSNLKFTGFVTNSGGTTCDGNWTNTTSECNNGTQTITWTGINSTNCTSPIIETINCTSTNTTSNQTSNITTNKTETNTPSNQTSNITTNQTEETDTQSESISCSEDWVCEEWSECEEGNQTRSCNDENDCGVEEGRPTEVKTCVVEAVVEETTEVETPTEQIVEPVAVVPTCTPEWKCGDWQECVNNKQPRVCVDVKMCNLSTGIPPTSQNCTSIIKANCSDKIKNQGETAVDCGGPCNKCGFLTMMGNAISGQNNGKSSLFKSLFGSVGNTLTTLAVLMVVMVTATFVTSFLKRKNKDISKK